MSNRMVPVAAALLAFWTAQVVHAGQVAYWAFEEGSGTTAKDSSGKGNSGTLTNGPLWGDGKVGKALKFDGVDDYVLVQHSASLCVTDGLTLSVWVNPERTDGPNASGYQGIIAKGGGPRSYSLYTTASGTLHFSTGPSGAFVGTVSSATVPINQWTHIAIKVEGGQHKYFLNGQPAGVGGSGVVLPGTADTAPVYLGRTSESAREFKGMIDEVRIYDLALTDAQIRDLFNNNPPNLAKAEKPTPADGATGITTPLFTWTAGNGALYHDVYLGTTPELTEANKIVSHQLFPMCWYTGTLVGGIPYYWRVDETAGDGTVTQGDVWTFTYTPSTAWQPVPPEGALNVKTSPNLAWTSGLNAISHDVYVGTSQADVAAGAQSVFKGNRPTTSIQVDGLTPETVYYWRVDEVGVAGKQAGAVWQFTTRPAIALTDPNLVGWWTFDEGAGTTAIDWSGHENDGTLRGNPQWVVGYDGGALKFDGAKDYVEVPHNANLCVTKEITVMAWINAERYEGPAGVTWQGILGKGNTVRSYSFYTQTGGTLHFSTTSNGAYVGSSSTGTVPLKEWTHVAAMIKAGAQMFFINGKDAGTGTGGITPPGASDTATVRIGTTQEDGRQFLGLIDDARIYNTALTAAQIATIMQGNPNLASNPQPGLGANVDIRDALELSWTAGKTAARHDVYFGKDQAAVKKAGPTAPEYQGRQTGTTLPLAALVEFGGGAYYWRIDEVEADGTTIHTGRLWTFTVPGYFIVDEFEQYTDVEGSCVYQSWIDGLTDGKSNSVVGYMEAPFTEHTIVHSGKQSMPFEYNNVDAPFYSEATRTFDTLQDWTANDVNALTVWVRGYAAATPVTVTETAGKISLTGAGTDIWGNSDDFTFAYKTLTGNGAIVARVVSTGTGSNTWAKGGVMIRDSLDGGSAFADMVLTGGGGNGTSFQYRPATDAAPGTATDAVSVVTAPYWVKIERVGDTITGSVSTDGKTWRIQGTPQTIAMNAPVYIGLCVTSHAAGEQRTFQFDSIATTGGVSGSWQGAAIATPRCNDPAPMYVVVEDSSGKTATATNAGLMNVTDWTAWTIPLQNLTGVNLSRVKKLYVGVGDRKASVAGGAGRIFIDDVRVTGP